MKASVEVRTRKDATAIQQALLDPVTYAFVVVTGTLAQLPSDRARRQVLEWLTDRLDEADGVTPGPDV